MKSDPQHQEYLKSITIGDPQNTVNPNAEAKAALLRKIKVDEEIKRKA
jgi:hypothetical protein